MRARHHERLMSNLQVRVKLDTTIGQAYGIDKNHTLKIKI